MQAILKKKRNWHFAQIEPCWAVCNLILGTYNKIQLQTQPKGLFFAVLQTHQTCDHNIKIGLLGWLKFGFVAKKNSLTSNSAVLVYIP